MTNSRRKAREVVLQAMYWTESSGDPIRRTLHTMALRLDLSPEVSRFARRLGEEAWARREDLDQMIGSVSENWSLDRISRIDRLILRMALSEMLGFDDIPAKVSLDEAIELAKRYSQEKSPGFVNGILDALLKREGMLEGVGEG
ncbi:MAG: transcription antitermination factor NusB [Candidatus Latescibacteria bacterium]|nr:transcription antitermination factor NusB [Candidatus Latescibacterota bacterium]